MTGQFSLDLSAFIAKTQANTDRVIREVVMELGARIVERSPVGNPDLWKSRRKPAGYVGGRFRANWQYGFGDAPSGHLPTVDKTGQASLNRLQAGVAASPVVGVHYIVNNLPYAIPLENGWSTQAPAGMVSLAVIDLQGIIRDVVAGVNP